jgi:NAD(P)-dependent dehydrogenase (short-subunit alcohol dehydrogenase family)
MTTILLTGATDGFGKYAATQLAGGDNVLLLHGRNEDKLDALVSALRGSDAPARLVPLVADLADLDQVAGLADEVSAHAGSLDVLVNNAGVGFGTPNSAREVGAQGYELRLTVNYLAPYLLASRLLPLVRSRIVNVASLGQVAIDFDDLMLEQDYSGINAYRRSKTALVMETIDLARDLAGRGVTANAVHPATFAATSMVIEAGVQPVSTVADGGDSILFLATDPSLDSVSGEFFNMTTRARAISQVYDAAARSRLRQLTEGLLKGYLRA